MTDFGWWAHSAICNADHVSYKCALETYVILFTPITLIKRKKEEARFVNVMGKVEQLMSRMLVL